MVKLLICNLLIISSCVSSSRENTTSFNSDLKISLIEVGIDTNVRNDSLLQPYQAHFIFNIKNESDSLIRFCTIRGFGFSEGGAFSISIQGINRILNTNYDNVDIPPKSSISVRGDLMLENFNSVIDFTDYKKDLIILVRDAKIVYEKESGVINVNRADSLRIISVSEGTVLDEIKV